MKRIFQMAFIILLIGLVGAGCSTTVRERQREPGGEKTESRAKYYHFDDVLIPHELNFKQKKSSFMKPRVLRQGFYILKSGDSMWTP